MICNNFTTNCPE
uniref:Uncharacterized protein n=1 Tax=Anguilla anguilla TaxID=7936 RepID=A0A0E9PGV1_ANGAN